MLPSTFSPPALPPEPELEVHWYCSTFLWHDPTLKEAQAVTFAIVRRLTWQCQVLEPIALRPASTMFAKYCGATTFQGNDAMGGVRLLGRFSLIPFILVEGAARGLH